MVSLDDRADADHRRNDVCKPARTVDRDLGADRLRWHGFITIALIVLIHGPLKRALPQPLKPGEVSLVRWLISQLAVALSGKLAAGFTPDADGAASLPPVELRTGFLRLRQPVGRRRPPSYATDTLRRGA